MWHVREKQERKSGPEGSQTASHRLACAHLPGAGSPSLTEGRSVSSTWAWGAKGAYVGPLAPCPGTRGRGWSHQDRLVPTFPGKGSRVCSLFWLMTHPLYPAQAGLRAFKDRCHTVGSLGSSRQYRDEAGVGAGTLGHVLRYSTETKQANKTCR